MGNYSAGTEYDINAPWNEHKQPEEFGLTYCKECGELYNFEEIEEYHDNHCNYVAICGNCRF